MVMEIPQRDLHIGHRESERYVEKAAACTLDLYENIVHGLANTATDDWTLTLPSVSQAIGLTFYIEATIANSKAITVQDNNDDAGLSNITLDGDGEYVMLFSTGKKWRELLTGYS